MYKYLISYKPVLSHSPFFRRLQLRNKTLLFFLESKPHYLRLHGCLATQRNVLTDFAAIHQSTTEINTTTKKQMVT
jgi:hypothetical protein